MDVQPKVYIILVNYNGYRDTIECLQSLRLVTYPNYEVIIVDNASQNESLKELKSFVREGEILIPSEVNGGFSAGNNIGIEYALEHGAEYCLLLNNDTVVEPDFLEKLIDGFSSTLSCGITIGKILYESNRNMVWYAGGAFNRKNGITQHWHYREKNCVDEAEMLSVTFATGCCLCISRNTIENIGLLDEEYFLYEEDTDYCCRVIDAGFSIIYVPNAVIYHKVNASAGKNSPLSQFYSMRNKYFIIDKYFRGKDRIRAMLYTIIQNLYRCLSGRIDYRLFKEAIIAYKNRETGKSLRV